jgi:hypothetical protein
MVCADHRLHIGGWRSCGDHTIRSACHAGKPATSLPAGTKTGVSVQLKAFFIWKSDSCTVVSCVRIDGLASKVVPPAVSEAASTRHRTCHSVGGSRNPAAAAAAADTPMTALVLRRMMR